jgi:hypothetical protein
MFTTRARQCARGLPDKPGGTNQAKPTAPHFDSELFWNLVRGTEFKKASEACPWGLRGRTKNPASALALCAAFVAVTADFGAGNGDLDLAVIFDLTLELFEKRAFHFPDLAAAQAGYVDVVAETMAFVVVLIAMDVEQVELVNQAVALEHVERAIDGDAVNARIDLLRQLENRPGVQVPLGIIHHLKQDAALAREAYAALGEGGLQAAGTGVGV